MMHDGMDSRMGEGMGWMMGGMGLVGFLTLIVLVLAALALVRYLRR